MEWFENVKDSATKTAHMVGNKANELVEIAKYSFAISENEATIDKLCKNIGYEIYNQGKSGTEFDGNIGNILNEIDSKYDQIEALKEQIQRIKKVKTCETCGTDNNHFANFCSKCGGKF